MSGPFAHTLDGQSPEKWEPLEKHLAEVAECAERFASAFGAGAWGRILGECHDLGKASSEFQAYLHSSNPQARSDASVEEETTVHGRVDHSTYGARYVARRAGKIANEVLAYCIAGHHAGLANATTTEFEAQRSTLRERLNPANVIPVVKEPEIALPKLALPFKYRKDHFEFSLAFFTRMLFSCLIDADRTCTEAFCSREAAYERQHAKPTLQDLRTAVDASLQEKQRQAKPTQVNEIRNEVLQECLSAASLPRGFFSLQVPTGGGKTLSSLAFALHHCQYEKAFRRIIVAIPFTSIIEQTAQVYRDCLGEFATYGLVEHHTNLKPQHHTRANQLAVENWDAPIIVTTNVQLFESLFAHSTTPCRKLHRLANSVIILDEAQTLPVELLTPTLAALRELVENYGCSVVLCTATQPALEKRGDFPMGIEGVRPIIAQPHELFKSLKRVEVRHTGKLTHEELVERLAQEERVLAIVNTRADATNTFELLRKAVGPESCFHLSTLMCGAHRREVLARIREAAKLGPCRVVSTQLIEAGVDLDLPVVYRAEAGFDSIAQAAGRCNREGLAALGTTYVFEFPKLPPPGFLRDTAQTARELFSLYPDPLTPDAILAYFRHHYWKSNDLLDKHGVLQKATLDGVQTRFQFREISAAYRFIRDEQMPILVQQNEESRKIICELQNGHVPFVSHRQMQPYLVSVPQNAIRALESEGAIQAHESGVWLQVRDDTYDPIRGLRLETLGLDSRAWNM